MEDDFLDLRRVWIEGTGEWVLHDPQFREWNSVGDGRSRIFSIHGPPGSGKSVLAAHLISTFTQQSGDSANGAEQDVCVYSFCRHNDDRKQDMKAILRTVIFDLADRIETYGQVLRDFFKAGAVTASDMNLMGFLWRKLLVRQMECSKFSGTIRWVIDGIDESDQDQLAEFLSYLPEIRHSDLCFKVVIVGRYDEATHTKLRAMGCKSIEVNAQTNLADIRTVIRHYIHSSELLSSPHISAEVTSWLESHACGLFLWIRLVFDEINTRRDFCATDLGIMERLRSLPKTLGETYDRILSTLHTNLTPSDLKFSKEIFKWTINVHRPLLLEELGSALEPIFGRLTNLGLEIKRCCGGLIVVDTGGNVKLLHLTIAEHANYATWFYTSPQIAHSQLAIRSLNSILPYEPEHPGFNYGIQPAPLTLYACRYWWYHVAGSAEEDEGLQNELLSFLRDSRVLSWIDNMFTTGYHFELPKAAKTLQNWVQKKCIPHRETPLLNAELGKMTTIWLKDLMGLMLKVSCGVEEYEGDKKDGLPHGYGKCSYDKEMVYEGFWEEGMRCGRGIFKFPGGVQYEGEFRRWFHGSGVYKFADGVSYTGTWVDKVPQLGGTWRFPDGTVRKHVPLDNGMPDETLPRLEYATFDGTCPISKHDAVGKFDNTTDPPTWIYPNGAQYKGGWKDGKESGYGEWLCVCGAEYRGEWRDGDHHGEGVWTHGQGLRRYSGGWSCGSRLGFGTLSFHSGDKFHGVLRGERERYGEGEMIFANGNRYVGMWQGGLLLGQANINFGKEWLNRVGIGG